MDRRIGKSPNKEIILASTTYSPGSKKEKNKKIYFGSHEKN